MIDTLCAETRLATREEFAQKSAVLTALATDPASGVSLLDRNDRLDRRGRRTEHSAWHFGPVNLHLHEDNLLVWLQIPSLPGLLLGHNGRLLTPTATGRAIDGVDQLLRPLDLDPLRAWMVNRVDFTHDFPVEDRLAGAYMRSFALRRLNQPGHPAYTVVWKNETLYFLWKSKNLRQIMLYDKALQLRTKGIRLPEGAIRLEVRELANGCRKLAGELLHSTLRTVSPLLGNGYLPVEAVLDPRVAHSVLDRYHRELDLGVDVDHEAVFEKLIDSGLKRGYPFQLYASHRLQCDGRSDDELAALLGTFGYRDGRRTLAELRRDLRSAGVALGIPAVERLPGLRLPVLAEFCGSAFPSGNAFLEEPVHPPTLRGKSPELAKVHHGRLRC